MNPCQHAHPVCLLVFGRLVCRVTFLLDDWIYTSVSAQWGGALPTGPHFSFMLIHKLQVGLIQSGKASFSCATLPSSTFTLCQPCWHLHSGGPKMETTSRVSLSWTH